MAWLFKIPGKVASHFKIKTSTMHFQPALLALTGFFVYIFYAVAKGV
jgi:hypothetical protein